MAANPRLPLRCASGSPGANFMSSLRDAFEASAVRGTVLAQQMGLVNPRSENPDLGHPAFGIEGC